MRGDDRYQTLADREFVQKALAAGGIVVTEMFSPRNARTWSRQIRLSIAGLEQALRTPLKNCGVT
jgi:DNA-binding transcriptional MocR family regulator